MDKLTAEINGRITNLKDRVNSLPCGGGLERLDIELLRIKNEIEVFRKFLVLRKFLENGNRKGE